MKNKQTGLTLIELLGLILLVAVVSSGIGYIKKVNSTETPIVVNDEVTVPKSIASASDFAKKEYPELENLTIRCQMTYAQDKYSSCEILDEKKDVIAKLRCDNNGCWVH